MAFEFERLFAALVVAVGQAGAAFVGLNAMLTNHEKQAAVTAAERLAHTTRMPPIFYLEMTDRIRARLGEGFAGIVIDPTGGAWTLVPLSAASDEG